MSALVRVQEWFEEAPIRLVPSVQLRVLPRLSTPSPRPQPGWRPWKPVVLPGGLPILNAFTIVQHPIPATGTSDASGNTVSSSTWASNPVQGNLLGATLTFRGNATTSEGTTQGWIKGPTITNGTTCQTEIWYRVAGAAEGAGEPTFVISANTLYVVDLVEISGFTGTPTLDRTGTAAGGPVATLATAVSATTTAASEFVFGGCGDAQGNTAGITWSASTAGGGATLGADIDTTNPPKNGEGLRDTWATSGASGTSPSITFNLSASTSTKLAACIASFKDVAAANVVVLLPQGTRQAIPRGSLY